MPNVTGAIPRRPDNSGSWQALWDSTNLYVLGSMQDSTIVANNDAVEVYVDGKQREGRIVHGGGLANGCSSTAARSRSTRAAGSGGNTAGIVKAEAAITGGYRMECKIPWSTIGVSAFASDNIGPGISPTATTWWPVRATTSSFWFSTTDNDWTNPSLFGTAKLSSGRGVPPVPTGLAATPGTHRSR